MACILLAAAWGDVKAATPSRAEGPRSRRQLTSFSGMPLPYNANPGPTDGYLLGAGSDARDVTILSPGGLQFGGSLVPVPFDGADNTLDRNVHAGRQTADGHVATASKANWLICFKDRSWYKVVQIQVHASGALHRVTAIPPAHAHGPHSERTPPSPLRDCAGTGFLYANEISSGYSSVASNPGTCGSTWPMENAVTIDLADPVEGGYQVMAMSWSIVIGSGCGCSASLNGDPHILGAEGDAFSMRGEHLGIYNMLSAPNTSFNAQFKWLPFDSPYSRVKVNGTFARIASWVLRTPRTGQQVRASFLAGTPHSANVYVGQRAVTLSDAVGGPANLELEGLSISLAKKTLTVTTPQWRMVAQSQVGYPHWGTLRLRLQVTALYHVCSDLSAAMPHGILGQTFDCDGKAIDGRKDTYDVLDDGRLTTSRVRGGAITTRAQAEGAIEGQVADYMVPSPFDVQFPYSRFDSTETGLWVASNWLPRNLSLLTGPRRLVESNAKPKARRKLEDRRKLSGCSCGWTPPNQWTLSGPRGCDCWWEPAGSGNCACCVDSGAVGCQCGWAGVPQQTKETCGQCGTQAGCPGIG